MKHLLSYLIITLFAATFVSKTHETMASTQYPSLTCKVEHLKYKLDPYYVNESTEFQLDIAPAPIFGSFHFIGSNGFFLRLVLHPTAYTHKLAAKNNTRELRKSEFGPFKEEVWHTIETMDFDTDALSGNYSFFEKICPSGSFLARLIPCVTEKNFSFKFSCNKITTDQ